MILHRDNCRLMPPQVPAGHAIAPHGRVVPNRWNVYFRANDADALFAEFKRRGARIDHAIGNKP